MRSKPRWLAVAFALAAVAINQRHSLADQDITLPTPIYLENFDELQELQLPPGWTVQNQTDTVTAGQDIEDLKSDTYKDWVVITADRISNLKSRVMQFNPTTVNGVALDALATGNLIYAESDSRGGNQYQNLYTSDYDLTGKTNIYLVFNSLYEQNQDNINGLEYSIDGGATWNPGLYYLYGGKDTGQDGPDMLTNNVGNLDLTKTLTVTGGGQAFGKSYGDFIMAPVTPELAVHILGRVNDDQLDGKRIEFVRLEKADNQKTVRFRFFQAGTGSWYWGVDSMGLYSLNEARIVVDPYILPDWGHNAQVNLGGSVTYNVVASGQGPLTYQWSHDGTPMNGATSATLTISNAKQTDAGLYTVTVKNSLGEATSEAGQLSIVATPQIDTQPQPALVSVGAPFSLTVAASGPGPITYKWQKGTQDIPNATNATYTVAAAAAGDAGAYHVVVSNPNGSVTSTDAQVDVFSGAITQDLVIHLPLDSNANDSSGKNNNGTPEKQTLLDGTDPGLPTFAGSGQRVGSGAIEIKDGQSINLGAPSDLSFGADTDFSYSFWVKAADANAWTGDPSFFSNKNWTSGGSAGYVVAAQGAGAWKWNWKAADAGRRDIGFPNIADNVWHNIIITHDRQTVASFYVDGVLKSTVPIAGDGDIDSFTGATYIGQDGTGGYGFNNDTGAHFKDIFIDDFGLWRRTLTAQEVASIYAHGLQGEDLTKASGEVVVLPPNVTTGPVSQVVNAGGSFTLTATVDGTAPFTYQWQKNSNDIAGATSATYTANNVDASAAGNYRVVVTNSKGSSTSSNAKIAVATGTLGSELVAYVKLNGDYTDASGRGNNATAKGAPTFEAGKFAQAMRFTTVKDGSKIDYASFGKPADLNFGDATDFSVSMWVNWTTSEDDLPFISNKDWNSSDNTGWGVFSQGSGKLRTQITGTPRGSANKVSTTATPVINDGKWHHVLVSFWRGVVASTYVDGQVANSLPMPNVAGSVDAGLDTNIAQDGNGTYTDGGSVLMTGLIDDVAIWRRVVTATEAGSIFSAGQNGGDLASLLGGSNAGPEIINVTYANGNLTFHVSANGTYQVQSKASLTDATWTNVGTPVSNGTFTVPASGKAGFFRLQQQ